MSFHLTMALLDSRERRISPGSHGGERKDARQHETCLLGKRSLEF